MQVGVRIHTRDRVWRVGTKDSTANIPVVGGDAVPAGPLQGGCRWAHLRMRSRIQVERISPPRLRVWWRSGRTRWRSYRCWRSQGLDGVAMARRALGLGKQLVHGSACGGLPSFQGGELVQHLGHDSVEAVELLRKVLHGRRHLGFKLRWLARSQVESATNWKRRTRSSVLSLSGAREVIGDGAGAANRRFAVAAADGESVSGAWSPESERSRRSGPSAPVWWSGSGTRLKRQATKIPRVWEKKLGGFHGEDEGTSL